MCAGVSRWSVRLAILDSQRHGVEREGDGERTDGVLGTVRRRANVPRENVRASEKKRKERKKLCSCEGGGNGRRAASLSVSETINRGKGEVI